MITFIINNWSTIIISLILLAVVVFIVVKLVKDKKKGKYAYFNLATKHSTVNIAFPEAFYSNELSSGVQEFEIYVSKVKELVQKHPNKIMVIAYGEITRKKKDKNGVNVSVISPNRILVDNKTYKQLVYR